MCAYVCQCVCEQVYQVYAQRSPEEVHSILRAIGADYLVLENSICYERRHRRGCRLRDLLDLANGHVGVIYLLWLKVRVSSAIFWLGERSQPPLRSMSSHPTCLSVSCSLSCHSLITTPATVFFPYYVVRCGTVWITKGETGICVAVGFSVI